MFQSKISGSNLNLIPNLGKTKFLIGKDKEQIFCCYR